MSADNSKTLEELEGSDWGEPTYDSHLVIECHRLRRVPLRDFTPENLRIMIGQKFGLENLVPIALTHLATDPFVEGDFYPGDLLRTLLAIPPPLWATHSELRQDAARVAATARAKLEDPGDPLIEEIPNLRIREDLTQALQHFLNDE